VQAGDTPYKIALSFGLSINELIAINNLDGHIIRVGQVLKLTSDANDAPATPLVITVQPGDSLWLLAHTHDVSWQAIADANGIPRANPTLRVGTRLTIPGRYTTGQAQGGYVPPSITVARGDTLEVLARRHGTTVSALMAANDLRGTMIRAGQTLRIAPATASPRPWRRPGRRPRPRARSCGPTTAPSPRASATASSASPARTSTPASTSPAGPASPSAPRPGARSPSAAGSTATATS
jgi:LysM repeat protein